MLATDAFWWSVKVILHRVFSMEGEGFRSTKAEASVPGCFCPGAYIRFLPPLSEQRRYYNAQSLCVYVSAEP